MALRNKKLSCNERELNANGTVDNVVSHQFLRTLYIKFPNTGGNIFNIAACLFSALNYITITEALDKQLTIKISDKNCE